MVLNILQKEPRKPAEYIRIIQLVSITKLLEPVYLFFLPISFYHPLAIFLHLIPFKPQQCFLVFLGVTSIIGKFDNKL